MPKLRACKTMALSVCWMLRERNLPFWRVWPYWIATPAIWALWMSRVPFRSLLKRAMRRRSSPSSAIFVRSARLHRAERTNIADEGELLLRMARLSSDRKGTRDIHNAQIAGVAIQYGQTRQNGRFLSRSIQQTDKAMVLQARNFGIVHLVVHSGVQIVSHFPVGVEDAHAEVELNMRDGAVDSDLAQGLRLDHG